MIIYIDKKSVPDIENIPNEVFKYLLEKATPEIERLNKLYQEYLGRGKRETQTKDNEVKVNVNYCNYVVKIVRGFFLGEPVKYDNNEKKTEKAFFSSNPQEVSVKKGKVVAHEWEKVGDTVIDISPVIDAYDKQIISKVDSKIGKYLGIFGNVQELTYASDDKNPIPKSAVFMPQCCILVQDNSIEHKNLFFMLFEQRERINHQKYYAVTVYTDKTEKEYESSDLSTFMFTASEAKEHYFGEVPCINYDNDDDRQSDIEQIASLSEAYSDLLSNRLTDKKKFIDAILALYGFELPENGKGDLLENKIIDGIPTDAKIEYIQKIFDESSVKILGDDLVRDIHKMSFTVDMSDEDFSGNITGVALGMKFMPMSHLAKTKILNMDEGLKKRFELYNNWLVKKQVMKPVSKSELDVVFTVDMPSNLKELVDIVEALEGRVDEATLLSLLPFVKDPVEMAKTMEAKNKEKQKQYLDSFGKHNPLEEHSEGEETETHEEDLDE